uniref:CCHC-type domain-containing protein n=1 Tax=Cannabis sativa TaxID=3483 RepID=A0A803P9L5_CANSA
MRINQQTTDFLTNVQANLANISLDNNTRGSHSYGGCGYRGSNRGGRTGNTNYGGRGRGTNRPICQLCGRTGHTIVKCCHWFDINFTRPPTENGASTSTTPSENPQAHISRTTTIPDLSTT